MNQLNNDGFFDLANLDQIEDEETGEQYLKQTIGSLRQNSFHTLAAKTMTQVIKTDAVGEEQAGQPLVREHTRFCKISENAKGEPSVTVSIYGDDGYEVHDQVMGLYAMLKKSLAGGFKT